MNSGRRALPEIRRDDKQPDGRHDGHDGMARWLKSAVVIWMQAGLICWV